MRGRAARAGGGAGGARAATSAGTSGSSMRPHSAAPLCGSARCPDRRWRRARGRVDRDRGGRMHRTKVRVLEDVLDANATIAAREPRRLRPGRRERRQPDELARRRQDDPARAVAARSRRACASACSRATCRARSTPTASPALHIPVTQINTDAGFGGECHLDANMVRSAIPVAPARRDRPAGDRERRQPRLPGRVPGRRGRAGDGLPRSPRARTSR